MVNLTAPCPACQAAARWVCATSPSGAFCAARHAAAFARPTNSHTGWRGLPCQHCTSPRRAAGLRERSQARSSSLSHVAQARCVDRSGRAVVVVADERHRAALARHGHRPLGIRAAADHVTERPELLGARTIGGVNHGLEGFGVRVRVAEDRDKAYWGCGTIRM